LIFFIFDIAPHSSIDSAPSNKSLRDDKYAAKMTAFLDKTTISDSDSDETNTDTASLSTSRPHSAAPKTGTRYTKSIRQTDRPKRSKRGYVAVTKLGLDSLATNSTKHTSKRDPPRAALKAHQPPTVGVVDPVSTVSTMTHAQQSDVLLEMHAMLKEQKQEIKKLKKRHELSKRTTLNLQHRIDSICDSLDELSRKTFVSDLSSVLLIMSAKA
jgi:hypothetical protein